MSEHLTALLLKTLTIAAGLAWFGWHAVSVLAQSLPAPETAGNLVVTAGSTGAIVGVLYWAINRLDRIVRELIAEREADERRREERWMAHDSKRDDTMLKIADKTSVALDRNSEALIRSEATMRRVEERHLRDERKTV